MPDLYTLVYDCEAPYPRIHAGTGHLAEPAVRVVPQFHVEGGALSPCCIVPDNLERKDSGRPDLLMTVCRRCGRRHFKGIAEAGRMGVSRA